MTIQPNFEKTVLNDTFEGKMSMQYAIAQWNDLRDGKEEALTSLYKHYYVGMMNYGLQVIADKEQIADCIAETFFHLWAKRSELPTIKNPRAYIFTALKRKALQKLRSDQSRLAREQRYSADYPVADLSSEAHFTTQQEYTTRLKHLEKSILKLTPRQQELLKLRFFDDLSYEEIAFTLKITRRTAYNIIQDALKALRIDLNNQTAPSINNLYGLLLLFFIDSLSQAPFLR